MTKEAKGEFKEGHEINTAVDIAIFNDKGEVLLGERLAEAGFGTWGFPGGHLRNGEKINDCAKRETGEELGTDARIDITDEVLAVRENSIEPHFIHHLTIIIKGKYLGGKIEVKEPDKCRQWGWFKLDNLPEKLFSGIQGTLTAYSQQQAKVVSDWK